MENRRGRLSSVLTRVSLKVSDNDYVRAVLARYLLYVFIGIEVLLLPKLLDEQTYNTYEYFKNLVYLSPFLLLGIPSGYIYVKYKEKYDVFSSIFFSLLLLSIVFVGGAVWYYIGEYVAIPVVLMIVYTLLEHYYKVKRKYVYAFSFKPLVSIMVLVLGYLIYQQYFRVGGELLALIVFISSFTIWLMFGLKALNFSLSIGKATLRNLGLVLRKGFPISAATALVAVLFFSDRYFIDKYFHDYLFTYSFAFNLSQLVIMALTTMSYVAVIDIGEKFEEHTRSRLKASLMNALLVFVLLFVICLGASELILPLVFDNFNNLTLMTAVLLFGKGLFFATGVIMPITMYHNYHTTLAMILFVVVLIAIGGSLLFIRNGFSVWSVLLINSIALLTYTVVCWVYIFRVIDYEKA